MSDFDNLLVYLRWLSEYMNGKHTEINTIKLNFYIKNHLHLKLIYHVDVNNQNVYFYTGGYEIFLGMASTVGEAIDCLSELITDKISTSDVKEYCRMSQINLTTSNI